MVEWPAVKGEVENRKEEGKQVQKEKRYRWRIKKEKRKRDMEKVGREVKERKKERQKRGNREPGKSGEKGVGRRRNRQRKEERENTIYIQNIIKWISERQQEKDIGRYEERGIHKGRESASFNVEKEENGIEEIGRCVNKKARKK